MDEKLRNELAAGIEEAMQQAEEPNPEQYEEQDKLIYLTISRKYVREGVECKDGKKRNIAFVPNGTKFNGKDISGFNFFPPMVYDSKFGNGCYALCYPSDFNINLLKDDEKVILSPEEFKKALNEGFREWRKSHKQEKEQEASEKTQKKSLNDKLSEAKESVENQEVVIPEKENNKQQETTR